MLSSPIPPWRPTFNNWLAQRDLSNLTPQRAAEMAFCDGFTIGHTLAQKQPAVTPEQMRKALDEAKAGPERMAAEMGRPPRPGNPGAAEPPGRQAAEQEEATGPDSTGNGD
jgi:hypothetical protein